VGGVITNPGLQQAWNLDATGNWKDFAQFDPANNATNTFDQQRTSNAANEIIDMVPTVGGTWATPGYDRNGNMTTMPQPQTSNPAFAYTATPDAWNRMMTLTDATTGLTVQQNQYDGRNFRTIRQTNSGGSLSESRDFYYSSAWQVLYETVSGTFDREYVWGIRYIDDLVLRTTSATQQYAMQDANWNVVGICDDYGNVLERYAYTAYGVCSFLDASFNSLSGSLYDWTVLYTGRVLDLATGLYYYRNRYYHPVLGVFVSRDPIGLLGGINLFEYLSGNPANGCDSLGFSVEDVHVGGVAGFDGAMDRLMKSDLVGKMWWARAFLENPSIAALGIIAKKFNPGVKTAGTNYFIYTCRCGWIDLGHIFYSAYTASLLKMITSPLNATALTLIAGYAMELHQAIAKLYGNTSAGKAFLDLLSGLTFGGMPNAKESLGGWANSAFTIEDLPSDWYGTNFGIDQPGVSGAGGAVLGKNWQPKYQKALESAIESIKARFDKLMKDCGAVDPNGQFGKNGEWLKGDANYLAAATGTAGFEDWVKTKNDKGSCGLAIHINPYRFFFMHGTTPSHSCVCDRKGNPKK
jgi:RHS repeat-associated protein